MVMHRVFGLALAGLILVAGLGRLSAEESRSKLPGRLGMLADRLGLSEEQADKVKKIHQEFDEKEDPLEQKIASLHREEHQAMARVLTEEQRAKVPEAMKAAWQRVWARLDKKLGLTDEQAERVQKIHDEYGPKFHELAESKAAKGSDYRRLRHQEFQAIRKELTEEQRAKLPGAVREEFHRYRGTEAREQALREAGEKLGLNEEQKEKLQKVREEYAPKVKEQVSELRKLHREEREAVEGVLSAEQKTKFQEMLKAHRGE